MHLSERPLKLGLLPSLIDQFKQYQYGVDLDYAVSCKYGMSPGARGGSSPLISEYEASLIDDPPKLHPRHATLMEDLLSNTGYVHYINLWY